MKIVILGAGQVGGTLAASLASEKMDITVVDSDGARLRELQDKLDIGTVSGHAAHPDVLRRAGLEDADMLVAVTGSDEINMIACQIAYSLYRTPTNPVSQTNASALAERLHIVSNVCGSISQQRLLSHPVTFPGITYSYQLGRE